MDNVRKKNRTPAGVQYRPQYVLDDIILKPI